jgi:hypothetical protein
MSIVQISMSFLYIILRISFFLFLGKRLSWNI